MLRALLLPSLIAVFASSAFAQAADPALLADINQMAAVDNHTHVPKLTAPGEKDDEYDALPCDTLEPSVAAAMTRPDNPQFLAAWKALWKYPYNDASPEHVKELLASKQRIRREQGDNYPAWVLDQLHIQTMFANRVAMGRGLDNARFRWVPYDDALLFPLENTGMADTPDRKFFFSREDALLKRYLAAVGEKGVPLTLDQYVTQVVRPTLEKQKQGGAVAIKFEAAYLRGLDFAPATEQVAASIYQLYSMGGAPPRDDYKKVQDYLFRLVAAEAGRLGLAVHIHTGGGCGGYFQLAGANPLQLESALDDPALRKTTFVLIHGGWPFTREMSLLLLKPNVYTDLSELTWLLSPHEMAGDVRQWLEMAPEKIMFGTDLFPGTPENDWEEIGWVTAHTAREALARALTGMIDDGEITRVQARALAEQVLSGTAAKLYGLR